MLLPSNVQVTSPMGCSATNGVLVLSQNNNDMTNNFCTSEVMVKPTLLER